MVKQQEQQKHYNDAKNGVYSNPGGSSSGPSVSSGGGSRGGTAESGKKHRGWGPKWVRKAASFVNEHKAVIVSTVVAVSVGAGCLAATGGAGSVGCMALAGAAGSAVHYAMSTPAEDWSVGGFATEVALGAATGAAFAGIGAALAPAAKAAASSAMRAVTPALKAGGTKVSTAASKSVTATRGALTKGKTCPNSFVAGTPVLLADGTTKPIEDVEAGDEVVATDPVSGRTEPEPVTEVRQKTSPRTMVDLILADGSRITTTDYHPFWDETAQAWVDALDLVVGHKLRQPEGELIAVGSLRTYEQTTPVYNFTVDELHTYYVGHEPVLVHNCGEKFTADQQKQLADFLGYTKVRGNHGKAAVYEMKDPAAGQPRFITRDIDQHAHQLGAAFKGASRISDLWRKDSRLGTYALDFDKKGMSTGLKWVAE